MYWSRVKTNVSCWINLFNWYASTDRTRECVQTQFGDQKINYFLLNKNIGGAGGFENGFKEVVESEWDWIWIVDDDAIADENCLEKYKRKLKSEELNKDIWIMMFW